MISEKQMKARELANILTLLKDGTTCDYQPKSGRVVIHDKADHVTEVPYPLFQTLQKIGLIGNPEPLHHFHPDFEVKATSPVIIYSLSALGKTYVKKADNK